MIKVVLFCLEDESDEQEDEPDEELVDESEAEDVGDLNDLLERANVELGGAVTGPSRNTGKLGFGFCTAKIKRVKLSKYRYTRQTSKPLPW